MSHGLGIYDKNGKEICAGDIIAEGVVGGLIWDGQAEIIKRPTAKVVVYDKLRLDLPVCVVGTRHMSYNAVQVSNGRIKITDQADGIVKNVIADKNGYGQYYLNCWDGVFLSWNDVEVIGHEDVNCEL